MDTQGLSNVNALAPTTHRVLVTGAGGGIGRTICPALVQRGHEVRGFDLRPNADLADMHLGDLTDADAVRRAVEGMDTVIHLAAIPGVRDMVKGLVGPNVIGPHHVMAACREAQVKRVVLASTIQVVGGLWKRIAERPLRVDHGTAPTNDYALTKLWLEDMGCMYATVHGLSVLAVRLAWFHRDAVALQRAPGYEEHASYLSHDDARRFFVRSVEADRPVAGQFAIVFAASLPPVANMGVDLEPARQLIGYEACDHFPEGTPSVCVKPAGEPDAAQSPSPQRACSCSGASLSRPLNGALRI